MNNKKRMMFVFEEDYYYITMKIISILQYMNCINSKLVDYRKSIEERAEKSTGYLYDTGNIRQAITVPTNSNSAWMVFKDMLMKKFPGI